MSMNRIVYRRNEKTKQSVVRLFVSEMEFNRDISILVKGAQTARTVAFPTTLKKASGGVFENNTFLKSVILNEGLERLGGTGDSKQHSGVFGNTLIQKIILPSTLRVLGNYTFYECKN